MHACIPSDADMQVHFYWYHAQPDMQGGRQTVLRVELPGVAAVMPGTKLQEHSGSEKAWVYSTVDFADEEQKPELFCIRFASIERVPAAPLLAQHMRYPPCCASSPMPISHQHAHHGIDCAGCAG